MLRLSRWVAVVAILLSASVAFAQQQRPGGGQGGRGPGGFGGPGGGFNSPLMLVANEAVQKDLGLKEEQISKIKTLGEDLREEMRPVFAGGFGGRDQSEEERNKQREKTAEAMKKINEKFQPKLNEILDASQRDRLKQIQLQTSGPQAYQNADVVSALKISKDQQEKLASITKEFGEKQRELFGQGFGEETRKKMLELSEARDKQLGEVLTADQKAEFDKLKGKPFDVAALRSGFGGGRGPGGQGGANPAGRPRRPQEGDKKADSKKSDN